jgi:hypothetical protein
VANFIDDLLGSELSLMFFISVVVWGMILFYLYLTNYNLKKMERELRSLQED